MDIETFYRVEIYIECSYNDWEKIEDKYYKISYKHKDVDASSFSGCPAAGPYLSMVSDSKTKLQKMLTEVLIYTSKFKNIKVV